MHRKGRRRAVVHAVGHEPGIRPEAGTLPAERPDLHVRVTPPAVAVKIQVQRRTAVVAYLCPRVTAHASTMAYRRQAPAIGTAHDQSTLLSEGRPIGRGPPEAIAWDVSAETSGPVASRMWSAGGWPDCDVTAQGESVTLRFRGTVTGVAAKTMMVRASSLSAAETDVRASRMRRINVFGRRMSAGLVTRRVMRCAEGMEYLDGVRLRWHRNRSQAMTLRYGWPRLGEDPVKSQPGSVSPVNIQPP